MDRSREIFIFKSRTTWSKRCDTIPVHIIKGIQNDGYLKCLSAIRNHVLSPYFANHNTLQRTPHCFDYRKYSFETLRAFPLRRFNPVSPADPTFPFKAALGFCDFGAHCSNGPRYTVVPCGIFWSNNKRIKKNIIKDEMT